MANNNKPSKYWRFNTWSRIEHGLLILSFTTLVITGLPQRYADSFLGSGMIQLMGGIETTRIIHHVAAAILVFETIYHLGRVSYKVFVLRLPLTMLPSPKDAKDTGHTVTYNLGLTPEAPKMGRYTFGEKVEYWAVIWGTAIMIITGFALWNPVLVTHYLPGQIIPASKAAHSAEALLATLSILSWHLYNVHLKHFNKSMFTGYISRHEMEEEHQLELAEIEQGVKVVRPPQNVVRRRNLVYWPIAIVLTTLMLLGAYLFLTIETTAITTVPRQDIEVFVPAVPTAELQ